MKNTFDLNEKLIEQAKPGDIFHIVERKSIHPNQNKDRKKGFHITVCQIETNGFYYFYGAGTPTTDYREARIAHSNMFVWGIESFKKLGNAGFKVNRYNEFQWVVTGIKNIDEQLANVGTQYQVFAKYASKRQMDNYLRREDINYHRENGRAVKRFCEGLAKRQKRILDGQHELCKAYSKHLIAKAGGRK